MKKIIMISVCILMLLVIVVSVMKKNNLLNKDSIENIVKENTKEDTDKNDIKFENRENVAIVDKGAEYNMWTSGEPDFTLSTRLFERNVGDMEYTIRGQHDWYLILQPGETIEREIVYECYYENDGSVFVNVQDINTDNFSGASVVDIK